ncbi:MAG TPA: FAD-dependent oxidoreductase [Kineosporiaceae bacterium]
MSTSTRCEYVVVGGGLLGACLAEELAGQGREVLVLDAGSHPGHATGVAAGVAVPSLRYAKDEAFHGWLARAGATLEADIARLEPQHGAFSLTRPVLRLLRAADLAALPGCAAIGEPATSADLDTLVPGLVLRPDEQPWLMPGGLSVDGPAYLRAVRSSAIAAGTLWWQQRQVTGLHEREDGVGVYCADGTSIDADRVVVTAGAWTGKLTGVPVTPQRGQLVLLRAPAVQLRCIVSSRLYLAPTPDGGLLAGATEERAGFDDRTTAGSVAGILGFAMRALPQLADATVVAARAGLRPVSATGRPLVGRVPGRSRVYVASGHAGHGLVSARATAQGAASGLLHGAWHTLPEEFCPGRGAAAAPGPVRVAAGSR